MRHIKVLIPQLPMADKIYPYLKKIDFNKYYSNMGPLLMDFEDRIAKHFGVNKQQIVTSANGTLALLQSLKSFDIEEGSLCVMPSWTFTATPAAAIFAGLKPHFIDIDKTSWAIHPEHVLPLVKKLKIGAVVPVAPFGVPLDIEAWNDFHLTTKIPVIIDAAACFDSLASKKNHSLPYMVSFHATKVFGIGEGAAVISPTEELAKKIRMNGNFGFQGTRESIFPGINAKLSEYAAAVGLAALDEWPSKREKWENLLSNFFKYAQRSDKYTTFPLHKPKWVTSYGLLQFKHIEDLEKVKVVLSSHSIDTIAWWGQGCHTQMAYKDYSRSHLPNTEYLSSRVLGLPFWLGLDNESLERIFSLINTALVSTTSRELYE